MKTTRDVFNSGPMRALGEAIRAERRASKLSQTQLGHLSGAGLNFVSQLERGKSTVRFDLVLALLEALGLEIRIARGKGGLVIDKEFQSQNLYYSET